MDFSIITIHYNKNESLTELMMILKGQINQSFEWVVLDDGSSIRPYEMLKNSGLEFKYGEQPDRGFRKSTLLNCALHLAEGEILVFLDPDIYPEGNDYLEKIKIKHQENPNMLMIHNRLRVENGKVIEDSAAYRWYKKPENGWRNMMGGNCSIRKENADLIGEMDEKYNGEWGFEDNDWAFRAQRMGFEIISEPSVVSRHIEHPRDYVVTGRNKAYFAAKNNVRIEEVIREYEN